METSSTTMKILLFLSFIFPNCGTYSDYDYSYVDSYDDIENQKALAALSDLSETAEYDRDYQESFVALSDWTKKIRLSQNRPKGYQKPSLKNPQKDYQLDFLKRDKRIWHYIESYQKFKWKINWLDYLTTVLSGLLNAVIVGGILLLPMAIESGFNGTVGYDQVITSNNLTQVTTVTNRVNYIINTTNFITQTVDLTQLEAITAELEMGFDTRVTNLVNTLTTADTTVNNLNTDLRNFELFLTGLPGLFNNNNNNNDESLQALIDIITAIINARSAALFTDAYPGFAGYDVSGLLGLGDNPDGPVEYIEIDMEEDAKPGSGFVHSAIWDYIVKAANLKPRNQLEARSLFKKNSQFDACLSSNSRNELLKGVICMVKHPSVKNDEFADFASVQL